MKDLVLHWDNSSMQIPTFIEQKDSLLTTDSLAPLETVSSVSETITRILDGVPVAPFLGSNSWVIAPQKTASRKVLLANDTHIGFAQPSVWYEAHIETPEFSFYGNFLAGVPFPMALYIGKGDEVLVPAHTFAASFLAVINTGAKPVPVDVEIDTGNLNVALCKKALTSKTKAIMPVHLYGNPCQMDAIKSFAKDHNLWIIEDNAQAVGATYNGKRTGTFGHVKDFDKDASTFTGKTRRQQIIDIRNLQEIKRRRLEEERARKLKEEKERKAKEEEEMLKRIQERAKAIEDSINNLQVIDTTLLEMPDSLNQNTENIIDGKEEILENVEQTIDENPIIENEAAVDSVGNEVDTDDYQFDTFSKGKRKSFLDKYRTKIEEQQKQAEEKVEITRSRPYEKQFAADNFVTSVRIDPQRGWGLLFEVAMAIILSGIVLLTVTVGSLNLQQIINRSPLEVLRKE